MGSVTILALPITYRTDIVEPNERNAGLFVPSPAMLRACTVMRISQGGYFYLPSGFSYCMRFDGPFICTSQNLLYPHDLVTWTAAVDLLFNSPAIEWATRYGFLQDYALYTSFPSLCAVSTYRQVSWVWGCFLRLRNRLINHAARFRSSFQLATAPVPTAADAFAHLFSHTLGLLSRFKTGHHTIFYRGQFYREVDFGWALEMFSRSLDYAAVLSTQVCFCSIVAVGDES